MSDFGTEELSARGVRAQARPFSYFDAFVKTFSDAYDRESNPDGYINLAVAQNNLTVDLLHDRFNDALKELSPSTTAQYDDMKGSHALRCAMARHMTRRVVADDSVEAVRAEDLVLSSGAGAVIENLVLCVCNEGDGVFIPSPYYPAFPNDLRARLGVQTVPVSSTRSSASRGRVCLPQVGADYDQAARRRNIEERKDLHMKMILLSNPSNPQGIIYSREDMEETIVWAVSQKLHVISDEIYACSIFGEGGHAFVSAISIVEKLIKDALDRGDAEFAQNCRDYVHVVYGMSKDFCASGYRVGALWTQNAGIHRALDNVSYFCAIPGPMQHALAIVLNDDEFLDGFFEENRKRLRKQYATVAERIDASVIEIVPTSGMFVYFNLRKYLPEIQPTYEDEHRLWNHIYTEAKVVLTPGKDCASDEPGWFRMCFAAVPEHTLRQAIERIRAAFETIRDSSRC